MRQFAVSAIGPDRPGLVASMTRCLTEGGLNVEDAQMTILRGRFTMTLMATAQDGVDLAAVRTDLESTGHRVGLDVVAITEIDEADLTSVAPSPTHVLTVHGVDRPGVIHAFSETLAVHEVNIIDLHQRVLDSRDEDAEELAAMLVEVVLPAGMSADALDALLESTRREQGIEIVIRPADDGE